MSEYEQVEIPECFRKATASTRAAFIRDGIVPRFNELCPIPRTREYDEKFEGVIDLAIGPMSVLLKVRSKDLVIETESLKRDLEKKENAG